LLSFISTSSPSATLTGDNIILKVDNQNCFSLPFDCVIESIYVTLGSSITYTFPAGSITYPYVQLYSAESGSNTFSPLPQSIAFPSQGYSGAVPANTLQTAMATQPTTSLAAGTRILITGEMAINGGTASKQRSYYFYFTGGIGLRASN
jgi:hypothetical protein